VSGVGAGVIVAGPVGADVVAESDRADELRDAFALATAIVEFATGAGQVAARTAPRIAGSMSAGTFDGSSPGWGGADTGVTGGELFSALAAGCGAPTVSSIVGTFANGSAGAAALGFAWEDGSERMSETTGTFRRTRRDFRVPGDVEAAALAGAGSAAWG
jgi:hypothetical protein